MLLCEEEQNRYQHKGHGINCEMNLSVRVRGPKVFYEPDLGPEFLRFGSVR